MNLADRNATELLAEIETLRRDRDELLAACVKVRGLLMLHAHWLPEMPAAIVEELDATIRNAETEP